MAVEVVGIRGASAIESGFLSDQSIGRVVQLIVFAGFVFDLGQQQLRVVVAIPQLRAVGIDPAADQMQVIVVFKAGDAAQFIAFGGDLAVGVVAERAAGACRKSRLNQSANGVPLVVGDGTVFVLTGNLPAQRIVGKPPLTTVRQGLFDQLPQGIPDEHMPAGVRITDRQQPTFCVVVIVGDMAVRIGRLGDVALSIALIFPHRFAAIPRMQETIAVFVGRRLVFRWNQRNQSSDLVVAVLGNRRPADPARQSADPCRRRP